MLDEYAMLELPGLMPPAEEMLTMCPPPSAFSSFAAQVLTFVTSTSITGQTMVIDGGMPGSMR